MWQNIKVAFLYWIDSLKKSIYKKIPELLLIIIPIVISFPNVLGRISNFIPYYHFIIIVVLILIFLLRIVIEYDDDKNIKTLNEKLNRTNARLEDLSQRALSLPTDFLKLLYRDFNFGNQERISLYVYNNDKFKIIARYSANPVYNELGRTEYESNQGYISKCWKNNNGAPYLFVSELPCSNKKSYYNKVCKESNIPEDILRKLNMKSRCYYIRMITSDVGYENPNGIIVLETIKPQFNIDLDYINKTIETHVILAHLHRLIENNSKGIRG